MRYIQRLNKGANKYNEIYTKAKQRCNKYNEIYTKAIDIYKVLNKYNEIYTKVNKCKQIQ